MQKIKFTEHVLPHGLAILLFLVVTVSFFNPLFFENKAINQHDIQQHIGSSKALRDYRDATGEEGLWAGAMFSGMPAYLVNLQWSDGVVVSMKKVMALFLPHPVGNIFLAFVCYYILLLAFRVRPYLAIAGAIAFGLSSYMIIGLWAGHNARIGAIAFMPLVVAGIHLAFSNRKLLGFGVTTAGLAFHLRENHLQITYYLLFIVAGYGLMQLVIAYREKRMLEFFKTLGLLVPAAAIAASTFFGQFWAITEYTRYSIRGPSELVKREKNRDADGLSKTYAFDYSNGIWEPMTLLIPNFYGGASRDSFAQDQNSNSYKALVNSNDNELANKLVSYTAAYWGPQQNTAPYYGGAIMVFLFVIGILFADRKYVWWLMPLGALSIVLSWGSSFSSFNYFLFDYLPGYNKFRSVTFALVIILFAMPLLGLIGLEKLLQGGWNKVVQKKLLLAVALIPGLCLVMAVSGGFGSFLRPEDDNLPAWFRSALHKDRIALLRADAWRTFWFTTIFAALLFACLRKWIKEYIVFLSLILLTILDLSFVDKRYLTKGDYQRKRENKFAMAAVDKQILTDKSYFRVYNLSNAMGEAHTSYFHNSIGGYHGAKMRRYLDLYDSCVIPETDKMFAGLRAGGAELDFRLAGVINMLNVKYVIHREREALLENKLANGPAWFVKEVASVNSPNEELKRVGEVDTKAVAVIDNSKFKVQGSTFEKDSLASVLLLEQKPYWMKYESESAYDGLAVFSEIYYPRGWHALIDGKEVPLLRVNYILRALEIPSGKHVVEFKFEPRPYVIGNKITIVSSWILLIVVAGSLGWNVGLKE